MIVLQLTCSPVMRIIPLIIITVPRNSQGVTVSPRKIIAKIIAKNGAVLKSGVALVTPDSCMLSVLRKRPKAKLKSPLNANQRNAIVCRPVMSSGLNTTARVITKMIPGIIDIQVPVVGRRCCSPKRTKTALNPQHVAARSARRIPNIVE